MRRDAKAAGSDRVSGGAEMNYSNVHVLVVIFFLA
jgi:hypothetical protein